MTDRPRIDVEPIRAALEVIADFNRLDLAAVDLYEHGKPLPVTPEIVNRFKITGLANKDFVRSEWWRGNV